MQDREKEISYVTVWGAVANLSLSALKFVSGVVGHSAAMVADAIHSLSDLVSDVVVLALVKVSSKGRDEDHDYGHGKFETLATAAVSLLLLVVGARLLAGSVTKIRSFFAGGELAVPKAIALWAALISIAVKEALYQWTAHVGRRLHSPAVVTNAWHHRSDALSSVGSALGIGAAILLGGRWAVLDPAVGCAISIFIIVISVKMALPALSELTEASLPADVEEDIRSIILSVEGVQDVHAIKTRKIGPGISIEAHIVVDPDMSVAEAHDITEVAEAAVRARYGSETYISLHVEPDCDAA